MSYLQWLGYRLLMQVAHRYHWHYAPPIYPGYDTQLWCKWCGFRMTVPNTGAPEEITHD